MTDVLELKEFFVEGGQAERSHVLLHISEPSTPEEKQKGYFFALTEITRGTKEQITELQDIIDAVESSYYSAAETADSDDFEAAIEAVNRRGHRVLRYPESETHCLVGVLRGNLVTFAYHGDPEIALLHNRHAGYEYINVTADGDDGQQAIQMFSSILQGSMKSGDFFYLATPRVRDFFLPDRIQKLITGRTTKEAVDHIQKVLAALRDRNSYGGILFHILPQQEAPKTGKQPHYVTPSKNLESAYPPKDETNYRPREKNNQRGSEFAGIVIMGLGRAAVGWLRLAKRALIGLGGLVIKIVILFSNLGGQRATVLAEIRRSYHHKRQAFAEIKLVSKLLLGAACLAIIIFAASAAYFRYKQKIEVRQKHDQAIMDEIRSKRDAAEASSIYGDNQKAVSLLQEAQGLINQLANTALGRKTMASELQKQLEQARVAIRKWTAVRSDMLIDIARSAPRSLADRLVALDDGLLAYGVRDTSLYRINVRAKKAEAIAHSAIPSLTAGNTPKEDDRVVFASGPKTVAEYDQTSGAFAPKDISFPKSEVALADLFVYNQRLFTLDTTTKQIYKHAKTQTGYDRGLPWIKDGSTAELNRAVSLAIDGDIFVLTSDGKILMFTAGSAKEFATAIDPALDKPLIIWTYNNVQNLYVLESTNKRIVVLDKSGKLIRQYSDPQWQNPTGMVVNEEKKLIFVLDNNKIYRFSIQ